jgi:amylosucrase
MIHIDLAYETMRTLNRLLPRLDAHFAQAARRQPEDWAAFQARLQAGFPRLFRLLLELYGGRYDFFFHLEQLLLLAAQSWLDRPPELRALDAAREQDPAWFQSEQMLGGVCYVDLFASDLDGIRAKLPYFRELGLTYLHLMPLFKSPEGENDGGYAISSYREVEPRLGTTEKLRSLAQALRQAGIVLVLDFVLNHTASDHTWAQQARQGDPEAQGYYYIFPDRTMPDAYEQHLREIFPDEHPGAFSPFQVDPNANGEGIRKGWVWTTFHTYQWDLNYSNPALFNQMASEMLFLANLGADVLRLDALAFTWKQLGATCESLPQAHLLIQAFNAVCRIACPGLLFKSEAIVHPDQVIQYISPDECQLSYNPLLMALLWNTMATRNVDLLSQALRTRFKLPPDCAWVNYVRCHDDIGWTFSDEDAAALGVNGFDHRRFLNAFYTGRFEGSFARGLPFQENPKTGDCRISGTCASLAGLEKALREETEAEVDLALRRIALLHGVILMVGGIPLIYLGDEIGMLNDYTYRADPAKVGDSRWVHRPAADAAAYAQRSDRASLPGRLYEMLARLVALRKAHPVFAGGDLQVIDTGNTHVLGFVRNKDGARFLVLANFSEAEQVISKNQLRLYGLSDSCANLLDGQPRPYADLALAPLELAILTC